MTRIKLPANPGRGSEFERGGVVNRRWAAAVPIAITAALAIVETACAPGVERQMVIPIQGAQDFGLNKSELARYNQTKEDFKNASEKKVFDLTTNVLSSLQAIIAGDLTRAATGMNITSEQVNVDFDQVEPFWINIGNDTLAFAPAPVSVDIQVEGEETSRTLLFMFGKAEGGKWGQVGFFSPDQKLNESGEINANSVLDLTENATPEIGGLVIASDGNERFSRQILFTKDQDGNLVLVETFSDPNKPSQTMVLNQNDLFNLADAPNQQQANFTNVSFKMAAPAIATVTPAPPGGSENEGGSGAEEEAATEAPTEAPVTKIELDQPMTTEFDLTNTDVMPSTNEEMVRAGDLREAVRQYWQETGLINPDGSVNKPENIIPAKPDWWRIVTFAPDGDAPGGDMDFGPFSNEYAPPENIETQPTDLLFKVKDKDGKVTGVLVTELLYYIDPSGKVAVEPIFFFVSISKVSNPTDFELHRLLRSFGHEKYADGSAAICLPYIGIKDGEEGDEFFLIRFIEDKDAYLAEPMQEEREAFARQVDATGNPEGMGNFWWAPNGAAIVPP